MPYDEENMLMLSGIQHFVFCPRQWALIHIDQQWADNGLTTSGSLLHEHADDPFYLPRNSKNVVVRRSVSVMSRKLGLYGIADVVEFHPVKSNGVELHIGTRNGRWEIVPVEYKHGEEKDDDSDVLQVVAQAMALEEQYGVPVTRGSIYYAKTRRRTDFVIDASLREKAITVAASMHELYQSKAIPKPEERIKRACRSCSVKDICQPKGRKSAVSYLQEVLS